MTSKSRNGACRPDNPHPRSTRKTELVWEGKCDEYGNRREVDVAGCAMPMDPARLNWQEVRKVAHYSLPTAAMPSGDRGAG